MARLLRRIARRARRLIAPAEVEARIRFAEADGERPRLHKYDPAARSATLSDHAVRIVDLRGAPVRPSLRREGFALAAHSSRVVDFEDAGEVERVYLPEVEALVRDALAARAAYALARTVLRSSASDGSDPRIEGTAGLAHIDHTPVSAPAGAMEALRRHGIDELPSGRLISCNVWRVLTPPPQDRPLAVCDMRSVEPADLITAESFGGKETGGQTEFLLLRHRSGQRWSYFSGMTPGEVLLVQQYDSGRSGPSGCPHAAFIDPTPHPGAHSRFSIEARVFAFLD